MVKGAKTWSLVKRYSSSDWWLLYPWNIIILLNTFGQRWSKFTWHLTPRKFPNNKITYITKANRIPVHTGSCTSQFRILPVPIHPNSGSYRFIYVTISVLTGFYTSQFRFLPVLIYITVPDLTSFYMTQFRFLQDPKHPNSSSYWFLYIHHSSGSYRFLYVTIPVLTGSYTSQFRFLLVLIYITVPDLTGSYTWVWKCVACLNVPSLREWSWNNLSPIWIWHHKSWK